MLVAIALGVGSVVIKGDDGVSRYKVSGVAVDSINWPPEDKK